MNDEQMMLIYEWIDSIPLSREKKNINRDFCDGALLGFFTDGSMAKWLKRLKENEAENT
jgi:hypothetical protein